MSKLFDWGRLPSNPFSVSLNLNNSPYLLGDKDLSLCKSGFLILGCVNGLKEIPPLAMCNTGLMSCEKKLFFRSRVLVHVTSHDLHSHYN